MTISSTASEISYAGDNVSVTFTIPFIFDSASDLKVIRTDASGNTTVLTSGFAVTGGGGSTGSLTLTSALATGYKLTILDDPQRTQDADYIANDDFPAESHEHALDRGVRISKRLWQLVQRCIRTADGDPISGVGMTLGAVDTRKGKYLFFNAVTGAIEYATALIGSTLSQSIIGQFLNPQTAAEITAGVTPVGYAYDSWIYDVRRVGVIPNSASAGAANYAALKALFSPNSAGPTGKFIFPNSTGADIYYIGASGSTCVIPIRAGCHLDLCGTTLQFTGTGTSADTNSGMLFALHDLSVENGNINVTWATGTSTSSGAAICIGARPSGSSYFQVTDSLLSVPLGNIELRKLRLSITVTGAGLSGAAGIALLGGIQGLVVENVYINGNGTLPQPITYEFGFATTTQPMQTSCMHEARFTNIYVHNCDNSVGQGLTLTGAYNVLVDGFRSTGVANPIVVNTGEAMNYLPWSSVDTYGAKHNITLKNLVLQGYSNVGVTIQGATSVTQGSGYLAWKASTAVAAGQIVFNIPEMYTCVTGGTTASSGGPTGTGTNIHDGTAVWNWLASSYPFTGGAANSAWPNETDLCDVTIENAAIDGGGGSSGTYGIWNQGASRIMVSSAFINNCGRGIVGTDESTLQVYNGVVILNSQQHGMQLDLGSAIWSPARLKKVEIRNCYIAGGSNSSAGTFFAISANVNTDSILVENSRFGYEVGYAGFADASQAGAITLSGNATNVIMRGNRCAAPVGVGNASYHSFASVIGGCRIENASGDLTTHGNWITDFISPSAQSITSNGQTISTQGLAYIRVTCSGSFTGLILQASTDVRQEITVINEGSGSLTFAAAATSNVADGTSDVITTLTARKFVWDTGSGVNKWYRAA